MPVIPDLLGPDGAGTAPLGWRPRHLVDPQMMAHAPALFWLVAALRPARAHVIGDRSGGGILAICQAMDKLDLPGRCTARADWTPDVPAALKRQASELYPDLLRLGADPDGPASLLLIDARRGMPDGWQGDLASDGIALILGGTAPEDATVLAGQDGVDLAILGGDVRCGADSRLILRRLGEALAALAQRAADAKADDQARREGRAAATELAELRAAHDARGQQLARLQQEVLTLREAAVEPEVLADLHSRLETEERTRFHETAALTTRLEAITAERDALAGQLADSHARAEKLARLEPELRQERDTRFAETAALTRHLEKLARDIQTLTSERDEARARADRQAKAARAAEGRIAELLASTSWRVTRPLRWIKDRGRRG